MASEPNRFGGPIHFSQQISRIKLESTGSLLLDSHQSPGSGWTFRKTLLVPIHFRKNAAGNPIALAFVSQIGWVLAQVSSAAFGFSFSEFNASPAFSERRRLSSADRIPWLPAKG